jgi:hypothetical protein
VSIPRLRSSLPRHVGGQRQRFWFKGRESIARVLLLSLVRLDIACLSYNGNANAKQCADQQGKR